ncbi:MAG: FHA domain-containing protein [Phycisphaerae bacterium]|jgi:pSer/pThr/pTyr-binding forkhead associated (FHA) protein
MSESTATIRQPNGELHLPESAPQVRVTAGAGSVAQKTWNLRRPVTLIGSRRPAHIVLHDKNVSRAHCVLVNTGADILLKDLNTSGGTQCNDERVDLAVLKDGDVITVGANRIQVAIRIPEDMSDDSGCGVAYVDPTRLGSPLAISLVHTDQAWRLEDAVTLIGRHDAAAIRLDHDKVARRHAVIFRFGAGTAIFEVGSEGDLAVNGEARSLSGLTDGDRVAIGPFGLQIGDGASAPAAGSESAQAPSLDELMEPDVPVAPEKEPPAADTKSPFSPLLLPDTSTELNGIESQLETIKNDIGDSWGRLNSWESQLQRDAVQLNQQEKDLEVRCQELDAKDAAVRGQLHDVTRYQEELEERERDLAAQLRKLQEQKDVLTASQSACAAQQADVEQRAKEIARREHVLAQRWTRLYAAKCPHCGKSLTKPEGGPS